ncbi:MAG TPA: SDR family NAD(P)-dependent oxidoreductase [Jatrophihabitans sp.]|jgi:NAD(P)-dependent dehydrogenase (short-subunit alcohol dehydrogenase family)
MLSFAGRVAVVTGGASGIGFAMAGRFAAEGMRVVLADVEEAPLREAESRLTVAGAEVHAVLTDVSDAAAVEHLADAAVERFGAVHLLCNNAGVGGARGLTWEFAPQVWDWILGVNLRGVVNGVHAFMPVLAQQDEAHIVNTTSIAGIVGGMGSAPYTVSKFAVVGLSEALRAELTHTGSRVGVSILCPGRIDTNIDRADRNWPEALGSKPTAQAADAVGPFPIPEPLLDMFNTPMPAGRVADLVVEGVRANRFWIVTHPAEVEYLAQGRTEQMVADSRSTG